MIIELGAFCLSLALALSIVQAVAAGWGWRGGAALQGAGRGAALGAFAATAGAAAALVWAFLASDFSVAAVAANSHTEKPLLYRVAGTWGNHEGSMLLWCLMLTGYGAAVAVYGRGLPEALRTLVVAVQGALGSLFLLFTVATSNPLARLALAPVEGRGLNPVLQDPALAAHPPFLYAGYVGFSVVFSFAVAGLIQGRVDAAWARWVRPWTLWSFSLLTVGITLGAFWAYYELGWGGWWFWDPVENASLLPWMAGAALLHSAVVTEKRGALAGWTVFLALCAFSFAMLGAFLVRSGVLTSVHAFAVDPARGALLLAILALAAGAGFTLFAWRARTLAPGGVFAPVSREGSIVLNNLFVSAAAAAVVLGTLYPLMVEAATGRPISVGPPYFNLTFAPIMAAAMLILPLGPLLAWKRGDALGALQRLWLAAALAVGAGLLAAATVAPGRALAAGGAALGVWLVAGTVLEALERVRLFRAPWAEVRRRAAGLPTGAWGTTLAHLGLGVFVFGACLEAAGKQEAVGVLAPEGVLKLGGYELALERVTGTEGPNYLAERAEVRASRKGREVCTAYPERRLYPVSRQTTSEVALCGSGPGDLYLVLGERRPGPDGRPAGWLLRAYHNPFAKLIFVGPLLIALGGLVSLSDRRLRLAVPAPRRAPVLEPAE
ncbi:MAG: heme lyase CcmF/NrfE family subunit [Proteobacteria bacterium]|nr:heme lyase CcmF/NrfE family subunit [Pseudomonadota bacterium]